MAQSLYARLFTWLLGKINQNLDETARDEMAQSLYARLFTWLVGKINQNLDETVAAHKQRRDSKDNTTTAQSAPVALVVRGEFEGAPASLSPSPHPSASSKTTTPPSRSSSSLHNFAVSRNSAVVSVTHNSAVTSVTSSGLRGNSTVTIGVLDMAGHESFPFNSLDTLMVNYANEKLQEYFLSTVLNGALAEYQAEGIVEAGETGLHSLPHCAEQSFNTTCLQLLEAPSRSVQKSSNNGKDMVDGPARTVALVSEFIAAGCAEPLAGFPMCFKVTHYWGEADYHCAGSLLKPLDNAAKKRVT
eukprot:g55445.t1